MPGLVSLCGCQAARGPQLPGEQRLEAGLLLCNCGGSGLCRTPENKSPPPISPPTQLSELRVKAALEMFCLELMWRSEKSQETGRFSK